MKAPHFALGGACTAAAVACALGISAQTVIFCEDSTQATLEQRLISLSMRSNGLLAKADEQGREFTPEEDAEFDDIGRTFDATSAQLERLRAGDSADQSGGVPRTAIRASGRLYGLGRRTTPELVDNLDAAGGRRPTVGAVGHHRADLSFSASTGAAGTGGFKSATEFLSAVVLASAKGARQDPRLVLNAAPGTYGSEGVGGDGGFAVPPDFRTAILAKVAGDDALLPLTDMTTSSSNGITFPVDETTPWQSAGGVQAYWDGEGQIKTQSKPQLGAKTVKLNKVIALVPLTDELLEDAPAMASYVNRKAPQKINYKVNEAIIRGTGVGMPLGILNSPGTVVVPEETSQAAGTVNYSNVLKLWTAILPEARRNARWLLSPDVEPQLLTMQFPGTGTAVPAYLPPGGASAAPFGTLLGRPIVYSQACSALGLQGDIIFGDLSNYLTVTKAGGIKTDMSIHIWFDYDITAFRFVLRVGGEPWWNSPVAPAQAGATSRGFFSTLATRA